MENKLEIGGNTIIGIESGSNANGSYVKLSDGTLIQWGRLQINFSNQSFKEGSFDLPVPFVTYAVAFMNNTSTSVNDYLLVWGSNIDIANTPGKLHWCVKVSTNTAITANSRGGNWIAIGRWK